MKLKKSSVAVASFLPGRAKDLSALRYLSRTTDDNIFYHKMFLWAKKVPEDD